MGIILKAVGLASLTTACLLRCDGAGAKPRRTVPDTPPIRSFACALVPHMEEARFRPGEPIVVVCEMKNTGSCPFTIWQCNFWPNHRVVVTDDRGRESELTPYGVECRERNTRYSGVRDRNRPVALQPGGSIKTAPPCDLARLYDLGPGSYRLVVTYDDPPLTISSEPLAFTIEE